MQKYFTEKQYWRTALTGLVIIIVLPIGLVFLSEINQTLTNIIVVVGIIVCVSLLVYYRFDLVLRGLF